MMEGRFFQIAAGAPTMKPKDTVYLAEIGEMLLHEEALEVYTETVQRLNERLEFHLAPASSKYHLAHPGGLMSHTVGVMARLMLFDNLLGLHDEYNYLDMCVAALCHDAGKAGIIRAGKHVPYYKCLSLHPPKYEHNSDFLKMPVPIASLLFIATQLADIYSPTPEVFQAIFAHDGQYVPENKSVQHGEAKLTLALHWADYYQCQLEQGRYRG